MISGSTNQSVLRRLAGGPVSTQNVPYRHRALRIRIVRFSYNRAWSQRKDYLYSFKVYYKCCLSDCNTWTGRKW